MKVIVPPIKCQGIKTKLAPLINEVAPKPISGTWIEPFCGSGVIALNLHPDKALLSDTNKHIIGLYRAVQAGTITAGTVRAFLEHEGTKLAQGGDEYYKQVRARFNVTNEPLDFLFLNRACFNGVMRFNRFGKFNVPFCHKPERFSQAYITKIANQVKTFAEIARYRRWQFEVMDSREALSEAREQDFVYIDPPYAGRHVDYYNSWDSADEADLIKLLKELPCKFLLSTWHSNKYRTNPAIDEHWQSPGFFLRTVQHFYHVGPTEDLRNAMMEALIANYALPHAEETQHRKYETVPMFAE